MDGLKKNSEPGNAKKNGMQSDNDDDKGGAGGILTQTWKTIVQVAVRTGGDAVAAQGAVEPGMAAFDILY